VASAGGRADARTASTPTGATTTTLYRDQVRALQITPVIARRGTGHGSGLGGCRWVVEGALAPLHVFRRLRIRWEIRDDIHHAFVTLGCAIICWRSLRKHSRC